MLYKKTLRPDVHVEIAKEANYLNVISATGRIRVRIHYLSGTVQDTELSTGMSLFDQQGFKLVVLQSEIAQKVEIWQSKTALNFTPLVNKTVGSASLLSSQGKVFYSEVNPIVPAREFRGKLTLQAEKDFYIGGEGMSASSAIKIPAFEAIQINTQGAIYGYSDDVTDSRVEKTVITNESTVTNEWFASGRTESMLEIAGNIYAVRNNSDLTVCYNGDLSQGFVSILNSYDVNGRIYQVGDEIVFAGTNLNVGYVVRVNTTNHTIIETHQLPSNQINGFHVNGDTAVVAHGGGIEIFNMTDLTAAPQSITKPSACNIAGSNSVILLSNNNVLIFDINRTSIFVVNPSDDSFTTTVLPIERSTESFGFDINGSGHLYICAFGGAGTKVIRTVDNGVSFGLFDIGKSAESIFSKGGAFVFGCKDGSIIYFNDGNTISISLNNAASIYSSLITNGFIYATQLGAIAQISGQIEITGGIDIRILEEVN